MNKKLTKKEDILILIKQVNDLCSSIVMVEKDEETPVH